MLTPRSVMTTSPIIPVVAIDDADKAVDLAHALMEGGINIIELTLRTEAALEAISAIAASLPSMVVGAGTVLNPVQFDKAVDHGAQFVISPGFTPTLLHHASHSNTPFIPGVANASAIMMALEYGLDAFKLFPATIVGGVPALKAFQGPFKEISFCPTGGITLDNFQEYLSLSNVLCVGSTWITPQDLIKDSDFESITLRCKKVLSLLQ